MDDEAYRLAQIAATLYTANDDKSLTAFHARIFEAQLLVKACRCAIDAEEERDAIRHTI